MKEILIGRHKELKDLREWGNSERSEFIVVYGRRRVGKTFLVKQAFKNDFTFHFSGSYATPRKEQLLRFALALREQSGDMECPVPQNWTMAFHYLKKLIEQKKRKKKIIFLDELPWLDTPKSGFISALENFWNDWCLWRNDIKLVICGSATSWIINKVIKNKGGLHNRLTHSIQLQPFDLKECEEYFKAYGFAFTRMQIAECYMTMGGIPYYYSLMNKGESLAENIDHLFFSQNAPLKNEFKELYAALFTNSQNYISVINALGKKGLGLTRRQILETSGLANNGDFSKILEDLELCGFIRAYLPFEKETGRKNRSTRMKRDTLFQLIDFYTLFYLKFQREHKTYNDRFWSSMANTPALNSWRGITFEMLCLNHMRQIKRALGIGDVASEVCSWIGKTNDRKVQIDMLINRKDQTVNLCEMKFYNRDFTIDKAYAEELQEKVDIFRESTKTHKAILLTLITTKGLHKNEYSDVVQRLVTLDALFE